MENKELTPLENWKEVKDYLYYCLYDIADGCEAIHYTSTSQYLQPHIDNVEKALKQLEEENEFLRKNNENLDETYFETWRVCEKLKENSNYALMFVDNVYCLVDTKDNKFNVIEHYEINNKGIIDNGTMATEKTTPLEALGRLRNILLAEGYWQDVLQDTIIIEEALGNYLEMLPEYEDTTKKLKALEIIKIADFSLEFDESQNEWFLYISNKEQRILVAKGTGVKTYDLLKEVLL